MFQSISNRAGGYASIATPRAKALRFSVPCNTPGAARVSGLLNRCFPAAILGAVIAFVVYSSDRMATSGFWSHIGHEVREAHRPAPSFANLDPTGSVVFKFRALLVDASRPDGTPVSVSFRSLPVAPEPVNGCDLPEGVLTQTAARSGAICHQGRYINDRGITAVTSTKPMVLLIDFLVVKSNDHEATETFAGNIKFFAHNAVVLKARRFEIKPEEAQQREGSFRGIPLSGFGSQAVETQSVNT